MSRKGILLVDDEKLALKYFTRSFSDRFRIYLAASPSEALKILETHRADIGVIITDQRMPESSGIELLKEVRKSHPDTVRILTTAYSDLDILVAAINVGAVHSFVSKPWKLDELENIVLNALDHHYDKERDSRIVHQKLEALKAALLRDKVHDVGMIAAKLGHYVYNALCPLTILLDHLIEPGGPHQTYPVDFLESLRDHIHDIVRTMKGLEDVTVPPAPSECGMLDVGKILTQALAETEILRKHKGLRFKKTAGRPLPRILGSASMIGKLFRFMIAEEIVSLPEKSVVHIRLSAHEVDGETLGINMEFEDFVPVAPHLHAESLLHPFNLRGSNPREFGVFLISCYFIAAHHGGSLNVRIKDDHGLSFSFFLPCDAKKTAPVNPGISKSFHPQSP